MLDQATKKRIDDARNILVGKVPDPKSQVEQITIALIYKFMDDMDQESIAMGGEASFFVGEYERFSWTKIFDPRLGGFEMLNLYGEAIQRMNLNPHIPQLFRDIFKNAYLPYRDPETLKLFLKTISEFHYDHSERLGDAFEYLLSVLGSQGDAGQFRTPRHIIEFMVQVVDPQKHETILDPACGTAGFLISAYKHIRQHNTNKTPGDLLTVHDRERMVDNFTGYDISPDMVRLSLVNMYLHGFVTPQIFEYDTLTSEERWNEYADVILANPPFMSPKGGIRPHKKFSVQSKRSEVLFVDYMAEHLTPDGRAAIIVPEGIIFQSGNAYKELRKYLVEKNFLWAVVSLPSGVFQPYSGVKTSILFLDKVLAKKTDRVLFVKVENDGYDLGAQRKVMDKNDLPVAMKVMQAWQHAVHKNEGEGFDINQLSVTSTLLVEKLRLAENGEYNLTSGKYLLSDVIKSKYQMKLLEEVCDFVRGPFGGSLKKEIFVKEGYLVYEQYHAINNDYSFERYFIDEIKFQEMKRFEVFSGDLLISCSGTMGKISIVPSHFRKGIINQALLKLTPKPEIIANYLKYVLESNEIQKKYFSNQQGVAIQNVVSVKQLKDIRIPLPPLEIQREIVEEIEGYQRIIDGARMVVDNWKPNIELELEEARKAAGVDQWEMVKLGDVCEVKGGKRLPKGEQFAKDITPHPYIRVSNFLNGDVNIDGIKYLTKEIHEKIMNYTISSNDVYISIAGTIGLFGNIPEELDGANLTENAAKLVFDEKRINKFFLAYIGNSKEVQRQIVTFTHAVGVPKLALERIKMIEIPLPPREIQDAIVEKIKLEKIIIKKNIELIKKYEKTINSIINKIWE